MRIHLKRLTVWSGNYDTYMQTRLEQEENQMKQYQWEQDKMAEVKEFVARFGHGTAKLAAQAKSREKALSRMQERGLTEAVVTEHVKAIPFPDCGKLPPPVMQFTMVTFTYNPEIKPLFTKLDFGVDLESRIALVGPNGAGKSTLLKLMIGELTPTDGMVKRHQHLRIGWYHQHLQELLDMTLTPLEFMLKSYPDTQLGEMGFRRVLGTFGISGQLQSTPLNVMSDGQKSRVVIAHLAFRQPHLLLLDEPTNHLDLETIDALAEGIRNFEGGLVLVSHDFRLINQVANEIWEVKNGVHKWKGDIMSYKKHLAVQVDAQRAKVATQAAKDRR
jgi:ATP-binding cassette subfamily F protein 2